MSFVVGGTAQHPSLGATSVCRPWRSPAQSLADLGSVPLGAADKILVQPHEKADRRLPGLCIFLSSINALC